MVRPFPTLGPLCARLVARAVVLRHGQRLGLFDGKLPIDRGVAAHGVHGLARRGRREALVVRLDRPGDIAFDQRGVAQGVIDLGSQWAIGVLAGFLVALAGLFVPAELE